jgi:hypothetical protein
VTAVIMIEDGYLVDSWAEDTARMDDAYWSRAARQPLSPQRFMDWWIARRWVMPRDVRRR